VAQPAAQSSVSSRRLAPPEPAVRAAAALAPLAWLYGSVVEARRCLYDAGWLRARALDVPVISIGNLTIGGSGKSPMTAHVADILHRAGLRPAVISRGYRGSHRGPATIVSSGKGPVAAASVAGDEPVMLARMLEGVPVIVSRRREDGATLAVQQMGARCVVLDDGFQHRALHRNLDILLLDSQEPPDAGRLLPAGRLREPLRAMGRAGAIVIMMRTGAAQARGEEEAILAACARHAPRALVFHALARPADVVEAVPGRALPIETLRGVHAACFAGIAHPDRFFEDAETCGARVVARLPFGDHHPYDQADIDRIAGEASRAQADLILTTMKDLARLDPGALPGLHALRQRVTVEEEERFAAVVCEAAS